MTLSRFLFICILITSASLYIYIEKQNELVGLRLAIPALEKEVKAIHEENIRLQYDIDRFESPVHLMELSRKPEFSHLTYPYKKDVMILPQPPPLPGESAP